MLRMVYFVQHLPVGHVEAETLRQLGLQHGRLSSSNVRQPLLELSVHGVQYSSLS